MSNYNSLKTTIDANIKQNGRQEIKGQILNSVLNQMVTTLGAGYQFAGIATIDTNPGTPDAKVFYIANGKGTYEKFGGINVTEDEVVVLYWDSSWHKVSTGIASQVKLSELDDTISFFDGRVNIFSIRGKNLRDDGSLANDDRFNATAYIPLKYIKNYKTEGIKILSGSFRCPAGSTYGVAYFYDADKVMIGNSKATSTFNSALPFPAEYIPDGAAFIRFNQYSNTSEVTLKMGVYDAIDDVIQNLDTMATSIKNQGDSINAVETKVDKEVPEIKTSVLGVQQSLIDEITRAKASENSNAIAIASAYSNNKDYTDSETQRASLSEQNIAANLTDEIRRATEREQAITSSVEELQRGGLQLKDSVLQNFVNTWLNNHPEATTTVLDNSIDGKKLVLGAVGFVTPQMFYNVADGDDWGNAFQAAVDSGFDVMIPSGAYTLRRPIQIHNRHNLAIEGIGNVELYRPSVVYSSESTFFDISQKSSGITIANLKFRSKQDKEGRAPYNHLRPNADGTADIRGHDSSGAVLSYGISSNINGVGILGSSKIILKNLEFENMSHDFYFNSNSDPSYDILVDGWYSRGANMPMYGSGLKRITFCNMDVEMGRYSGEGDHCIYIGSSEYIVIKDGKFNLSYDSLQETALQNGCGSYVMLAFHGATQNSKYITIKNIVSDRAGRFVFMPLCVHSTIEGCEVSQYENDSINSELIILGNTYTGDSDLTIKDSHLSGNSSCECIVWFNGPSTLKLWHCTVTNRATGKIIFHVVNLFAESCIIRGAQIANTNATNDSIYYFKNCDIEQIVEYSRLFRATNKNTKIIFFNCVIKGLNTSYFLYPAGSNDADFFSVINTFAFGITRFVHEVSDHGSVAINSYIDGTLVVANP